MAGVKTLNIGRSGFKSGQGTSGTGIWMDLLLGQEAGTWIGLVSSQVKEQRQISQFRSPFIVSGVGGATSGPLGSLLIGPQ